jgi:hypothetical protein
MREHIGEAERPPIAQAVGFQYIVQPPLAFSTRPLIHPLSEPVSQLTTAAISDAVPTRCQIGVLFSCISTISLGMLASMSLSTGPEVTALTVVPSLPTSAVQHLVRPSSAALLEQYIERLANPARAPTDDTLINSTGVAQMWQNSFGQQCWGSYVGVIDTRKVVSTDIFQGFVKLCSSIVNKDVNLAASV